MCPQSDRVTVVRRSLGRDEELGVGARRARISQENSPTANLGETYAKIYTKNI